MKNLMDNNYYKYDVPLESYDDMIDSFYNMLDDLEKNIPFFTLEIPHRSIFNVEMFWVFCHIIKFKPSLFFESGVFKGRSTIILAETMRRFLPNSKLIAVGKEKFPEMDMIKEIYGEIEIFVKNGFIMAEELKGTKETMGVLIDGPKMPDIEKRKYKIYDDLLSCENIKFIFQHDVSPFHAKINRYKFEYYYEHILNNKNIKCYLIDDDFEDKYGFLDIGNKKEFIKRNLGLLITEKWF